MNSAIPEWVHVWMWYRRTNPKDKRPFPQHRSPDSMSDMDYELLRERWTNRDESEEEAA